MSATQRLLRFGIFELNLDTEELRRAETVIKLPPQSFKLLALLASRSGQVVSRDEIEKQLWGEETFVDFEHGVNKCIKQIRNALGDNADHPLYIETLPRQGYRFVAPVVSKTIPAPQPQVVESTSGVRSRVPLPVGASGGGPAAVAGAAAPVYSPAEPAVATVPEPEVAPSAELRSQRWRVRLLWIAAALVLGMVVSGGFYWRAHRAHALTEKDTIVVAAFENRTDEPRFDTLRQALSAQLEQSPFLNQLSDTRIMQTLQLMAQPKEARLTAELAREVCQRTGSAATIEGAIAQLGSQYALELSAVNCQNGEQLAKEWVTVNHKEDVIKALRGPAANLRKKLGESLASVQKYDKPAEDVTTSSLDALQAYSHGYQAQIVKSDFSAAAPLFQRAINFDPNFAMAYARLGNGYYNQGQTARAAENLGQAYKLRERVSDKERFYIESHYQQAVSGDLNAVRSTLETWAQTYPRDSSPQGQLGVTYSELGDDGKALSAYQQFLKLNPGSGLAHHDLVAGYLYLNRLDESKASAQEARNHGFDDPYMHLYLYEVDFLQRDTAGMEREASDLMGKPGEEDAMLQAESDTAAYAGQFVQARELSRRAADSARRSDQKETAATYEAEAAVCEALAGNKGNARQQAQAALALSHGRDVEALAATALALAGESAQANRLADDLAKRFPDDTIVQSNYLPVIRAADALQRGNPGKAIEALAASSYELGLTAHSVNFSLYPAYLRGMAYLAAHQGPEAAAEFQKIVAHPGVVVNEPIGALAHLGLGRAYALSGDTTKAKAAYQQFLGLWKDADADLPILGQAQAEYARLQ